MSVVRTLAVVVPSLLLLVTLGACNSDDSFLAEAGLPTESAVIEDVEGDVRDAEGEKPLADARAADIVAAAIHLSDTDLSLAIQQTTPIPADLTPSTTDAGGKEWLVYTLFIADEQGTHLYMPRVMLEGSDWSPEVFDHGTGKSTPLEGDPQVVGSIVVYSFPRALLPELPVPFKWAVGTEWSRTDALDAGGLVSFGDQVTEDNSDFYSGYPAEWSVYPQ